MIGEQFLDRCRVTMDIPQARAEVRGWGLLCVGALALAGVFAVLLALSRTPGIETLLPWPVGFFKKGLVIHVVFSFVVWFIAVQGGLTVLATWITAKQPLRAAWLGRVGVFAAWGSVPLLFIPAFQNEGEASLNNYVPVIIDPMYYTGLAVLALGVLLVIIRLLINLPGSQNLGNSAVADLRLTSITGAMVFVLTLVATLLAWRAQLGEAVSPAYNEDLFWAAGHILQLGNGVWLLAGWSLLAFMCIPPKPADEDTAWSLPVSAFSLVLVACAIYAVGLFVLREPFSGPWRDAYTNLQYPFGVVMALAAMRTLTRPRAWAAVRAGARHLATDTAALCLLASIIVFGFGGVLGLAVDGLDTRTPAHYHAIIGGINLAFIGLFLMLILPALGCKTIGRRTIYWMIGLYMGGQILQSAGLFLAGGQGTPRKTAGAEQGLRTTAEYLGMSLNGMGGLIAIIGGIMFIWVVGSRLLRAQQAHQT